MIIQCDKCKARYRMDPNKIGPKGAKVRCAKCSNVFTVANTPTDTPNTSAPSTPTNPKALAQDPFSVFDVGDNTNESARPAQVQKAPIKEETQKIKTPSEDIFAPLGLETSKDQDLTLSAEQKEKELPKSPLDLGSETDSLSTKSQTQEEPVSNSQSEFEPIETPSAKPTIPNMALDDGLFGDDTGPSLPKEPSRNLTPKPEVEKGEKRREKSLGKIELKSAHPALAQPKKQDLSKPSVAVLEGPLTLKQRLIRIGFVSFIMILGLGLGFGAMGVKPMPMEMFALFRYGAKNLQPGLNILTYKGKLLSSQDGKPELMIEGVLLNYSDTPSEPRILQVETFLENGEYLARMKAPCCEDAVPAYTEIPFSLRMPLPNRTLGRYLVRLEN